MARHGATMVYTQMILADRFLNDHQYRELHLEDIKAWCDLRDLIGGSNIVPLIVQLGGNNVEKLLETAKPLMAWCDGFGELCLHIQYRSCLSLLNFCF